MMDSRQREYNWNDICKLIWKDMGLNSVEERRTNGEMWYTGGFAPPDEATETVLRVAVYDKPLSDRLKEHGIL